MERSRTLEERDAAYGKAVAHRDIAGLYSGFQSAATVLRIARSLDELDGTVALASLTTGDDALDNFFQTLDEVERQLSLPRPRAESAFPSHAPFVVVVEGIDGSGKSSVVQELASRCNGMTIGACQVRGVSMGTPTKSLSSIRPVFDKRGGSVARAFYMVSNYVLQYEMRQFALDSQVDEPLVVFVDRWYGSTLAYSISWRNTRGGIESINKLFEESPNLFSWPSDLDPPQLMILLDVEAKVRKARVSSRNQTSLYNPWDGRLNDDDELGGRIMRCFQLLEGPREKVTVDASPAKDAVIASAFAVATDRIRRHFAPFEYWSMDPMTWFCWESSQVGLCDFHSHKRRTHAPWAMQLATTPTPEHDHDLVVPSLRTVGVHSVDSSGIIFFTWGSPGGGMQSVETEGGILPTPVSVVCVLGEYPYEQQWRGEGVACHVSPAECELLKLEPPAALCSHIYACKSLSQKSASMLTRQERPKGYNSLALALRQSPVLEMEKMRDVQCYRFVPLRIEVLVGGPSSPRGPHRYEWRRGETATGWVNARAILPFTVPGSVPCLSLSWSPTRRRCFTLALTGTHCAGKATIGRKVAEILGWSFDPELGEVLREHVTPGGHKTGYSSNAMSWDDLILDEEQKRDSSKAVSRVVETWHVGNLAWALWRRLQRGGGGTTENDALVQGYLDVARRAAQDSVVLQVHLSTIDGVSARRRAVSSNAERLPMESEAAECRDLRAALDVRALEFVRSLQESENPVPTLVVDNSTDGEAAQRIVSESIVKFVNDNLWRAHHPTL
jgi:thymidylate kinase